MIPLPVRVHLPLSVQPEFPIGAGLFRGAGTGPYLRVGHTVYGVVWMRHARP